MLRAFADFTIKPLHNLNVGYHAVVHIFYQGIDYGRHRARWVCGHACKQSEQGAAPDCDYLNKKRGQYLYVQRCLPGGCYRLARLVPHGSKSWKRRTRWRNTSESRNGSLESKGLLQLSDYGRSHGAFLVVGADLLENLCTLARLVYEATLLDGRFQPRPLLPALTQTITSADQLRREEEDRDAQEVPHLG